VADRTLILGAGLGAATLLYVLSRTEKGGEVVASVTDAAMGLLPRGIRNNNPGNLRYLDPKNAWRGQIASDGAFGIYDTPANGVRAIAKQLQKYTATGARTVTDYVSRWAPAHENPTDAYVEHVANSLGVSPSAPINLYANLPNFVAAIIRQENGFNPYSATDLNSWVYLV
jgi:hypothetical protein